MDYGADAHQLTLPIPGLGSTPPPPKRTSRHERVHVNRNLKMSSIDWLGFDMDYTLAVYDQEQMDSLSVELTIERLIERGYPSHLRNLEYDYRFPIRGLLIDKRHGHVLKMNRFKFVRHAYHGMRRLPKETIRALYNEKRIRPHTPRYHWIDTLFSLSEVTSYVSIINALEQHGEKVDYDALFRHVRESIDDAHRDGAVYDVVLSDLPRYIHRDPHLAETLHKLRSAGKKLFLLTNSPAAYTEGVMRYLLGDALQEYPTWRHYFDVIVVAAQKPRWFKEGRPLMERDGKILRDVEAGLEKGRIYEGGNLRDFERRIEVKSSSVLYVGDHIYGDMLRSKKESAWRTAMIIPELDAELDAHEASAHEMASQRRLEEARDNLEDELRFYQARAKQLAKRSGAGAGRERTRTKRAIERLRRELRRIDDEHSALEEIVDRRFHPYWGSLLKEHNEMSIFGLQVETYADLYMRRVSCFRHYSPLQFFRSPHDLMPHEL